MSRRESWWKDVEILMLRHQLAVAERERPRAHSRLAWPDRAWLALLAATLPIERLAGMRLIVTPGTILRSHRDIVRRRWACRSRRGRSGQPPMGRNVRSVVLRLARENESWVTGGSTASWPDWLEFLRSQAQRILALDFFTADLLNGVWNQRHLMTVLQEYEYFYNTHRPHRTLRQAASLRPLPDGVTDLDHFRVQRRARAGGVIHEYHLVA